MPTLKEIKVRIASVRNTLKITSAMKLVSSARLRKAQRALENIRPYAEQLQGILSSLRGTQLMELADFVRTGDAPCLIVAIASNTALCGGFNAAVLARVREIRREGDVVYSIGRKMADAMRRDGFPSPQELSNLAEQADFAPLEALVRTLYKAWKEGQFAQVLLVYNHFVSTARYSPVVQLLLPEDITPVTLDGCEDSLIVEPSRKELLRRLLPQIHRLKLYLALLDSAAAEHAARTIAMQTATENGEKLLQELTLQYNKGRQQKITAEILDLAAGQGTE